MVRTRERVVAAAVDLLVEHGLDGLTHSAVAEASGVGRATIYRHWATSEDLLVDVLGARHPAGAIEAESLPDDLRAVMLFALGTMARTMRDDPLAGIMLSIIDRSQRDARFRWVREQLMGAPPAVVQPLIEAAIAAGELRADLDPRDMAAMLGGPILLRTLAFDEPPDDAFVGRVVDGFLAANRPEDPDE